MTWVLLSDQMNDHLCLTVDTHKHTTQVFAHLVNTQHRYKMNDSKGSCSSAMKTSKRNAKERKKNQQFLQKKKKWTKQKQINKKTRSEKQIDRLSPIQHNHKQLLYGFVLQNHDHRENHYRLKWVGSKAFKILCHNCELGRGETIDMTRSPSVWSFTSVSWTCLHLDWQLCV